MSYKSQETMPLRPLIADPSLEYLMSFMLDPDAKVVPPFTASSSSKMESLLTKPGAQFSAIFVNPEMCSTTSQAKIDVAIHSLPKVPIFYMTSNMSTYAPSFPERKFIQRPTSYSEVLRIADLYRNIFSLEEALQSTAKFDDKNGDEVREADQNFVAIRAKHFISVSVPLFNIYMRLGENHYRKILTAGLKSKSKEVDELVRTGVGSIYVRREASEHYLRYCDRTSLILIEKPGMPASTKLSFLLNHGDEVLNYIRHFGLDDHSVVYARRFVECIRVFSLSMTNLSGAQIREALDGAETYSHESLATLFSLLLLTKMEFESARSYECIGLAAFLHDIGLDSDLHALETGRYGELTKEKVELFVRHPDISAKMLKKISGIDPIVVEAVEKHHEPIKPTDHLNDPNREFILGVREIVQLSDEVANHLNFCHSKAWPEKFLKTKMGDKFSAALLLAFSQLFVGGKNV